MLEKFRKILLTEPLRTHAIEFPGSLYAVCGRLISRPYRLVRTTEEVTCLDCLKALEK